MGNHDMGSVFYHLVLSVVGGAIGSALTLWLGWRQFRTQRWWDRKAEAYIAIINAFQDLLDEDNAYWEALIAPAHGPREELAQRLRDRSREATAEIVRQRRLASFLIHEAADDVLKTMFTALENATLETDLTVYRDRTANALWEGFDSVKIIAMNDLGVSGRRLPWFLLKR